jgi:hypothetical protein
MLLIFPRSMIIPEILEHLEDTNFEDWLTAALIENANQQPPDDPGAKGTEHSPSGITDLWMLQIAERDGTVWTGKFQVEFNKQNGELSHGARWTENGSGEFCFTLDTHSAEITFESKGLQKQIREPLPK